MLSLSLVMLLSKRKEVNDEGKKDLRFPFPTLSNSFHFSPLMNWNTYVLCSRLSRIVRYRPCGQKKNANKKFRKSRFENWATVNCVPSITPASTFHAYSILSFPAAAVPSLLAEKSDL